MKLNWRIGQGGGRHRPAFAADRISGAHVGALACAEGDDAGGIRLRRGDQPVAIRIVERDDGGAAFLQPFENLGLGVGNLLLAGEIFAMGRGDGGDERDVGPHQPGQSGKLAGMVHAHFEHAEAGVARHPRQAQRHPGMIVVALDRTVGAARRGAVERGVERFLGAGLADRAGDADHPGAAARAGGAAQRGERGHRVGDAHVGLGRRFGHQSPRRSRTEGLIDEKMAVGGLPPERDEQVARPDLAGVEGDAADREAAVRGAAGGRGDLGGGPEAHAASSRATATSSNGSTRSPTIWPCS